VRKKEPATIVAMKGRPKSAKGCLPRADRYREAIVFASAAERNFLLGKTAILRDCNCSGAVVVASAMCNVVNPFFEERWRKAALPFSY